MLSLKTCLIGALAAFTTAQDATVECPDINGDGTINVPDVLGLLSAFGSDDANADINGDGVVNVSDILATLSAFGATCTVVDGSENTTGGSDGSEGVNCCGGGAACGYQHCPALGDGQDGCVQPWNMPNGLNFETDCTVSTGACTQFEDCGGQVWDDCASSCPEICGEPAALICNMMCNSRYDCPSDQYWDANAGGVCVATEADCSGGGGELPPGVAMGRPFTKSAPVTKGVPVTATAEERTSDWSF